MNTTTSAPEAASALSLRFVLGVTTPDIARLFLVSEPTMAARITRAKKKIVAAGIPYAVPDAAALPSRLEVVAQTAYLAFTAGYAPGSGPDLLRADLAGEAIRLVRVARPLHPSPALDQLLALMVLHHSRRDARLADDGRTISLQTGQRALVSLGDDFDWTVQVEDASILSRVTGVTVLDGAHILYQANRVGQTTLTASGEPACRKAQPACALPSRTLCVSIAVQ